MRMDFESLLESMDGIALIIDRDLKIQCVGTRNWRAFWHENKGGQPDTPVIGRAITDAFTVGSVRDTFRRVLGEVFEGKRASLRVDFRCDAPDELRCMRLSVTPIISRGDARIHHLLYQSVLIESQPRKRLALFDVPATGLQRPDLLRICCLCARVATAADADGRQQWIDAKDYYAGGGKEVSMLSHGFCEPCANKLLADDDAARQSAEPLPDPAAPLSSTASATNRLTRLYMRFELPGA